MQSRRIFEQTGTWPSLYGGEGGGHGYIKTEEKATKLSAKTKLVSSFHVNQRDEVIDLHGLSGALLASRNMQMQTFVKQEPVLCINDQGGERMDITEEITCTLRAGMGGHPPLVARPEQPQAAGVASKGDGGCFLTPEIHTALTKGGSQAGQGYPCVLTAAFCGNAGAEARGIGYQDECAPTIKTGTAPAVLCLNDQGGSRMHCTEDMAGTLRAQEHGHQPLIFDNHGQDSRFTGPVTISQTVSAGFGMGGNNQPLVMAAQQGGAEIGEGVCPTITASAGMSGNNQSVLFENHPKDGRYNGPLGVAPTLAARMGTRGNNVPLVGHPLQETICIAGNTIDREPQNGGNGLGCQPDVAYTLTATDHHAVFSRQRSDEFLENEVAATQSARQHKDATDLVCQPYQETVGTIGYSDHKGVNNQFVSEDKCIVERRSLIRRLTPLECERLQGFPDGWTLIPAASDSARYKALGNSVAIPCVDFVMRGIAYFLRRIKGGENPPV